MLRVALGLLVLPRIACLEEAARQLPDLFERGAEQLLFELGPHVCWNRLDRVVVEVGVVEARAASGEDGAAMQDLHPHAHLEHVGRGRHAYVGDSGLGE